MIPISDKIHLRPFTNADAEELFALIELNRKHLRAFLPWVDNVHAVEDSQNFIDIATENIEDVYSNKFVRAIISENKLVGVVDFHKGDAKHKILEIGYWLSKENGGQGIMTKATAAMINQAFEYSDANRIIIRCVTNNFKSQAVAERLGFTKEGVDRQARFSEGRFIDINRNSILRHEWKDQAILAKVLSS